MIIGDTLTNKLKVSKLEIAYFIALLAFNISLLQVIKIIPILQFVK